MGIFSPKLKRYQKEFDYSYSFGTYPTIDLLKYKKDNGIKVLIHSKNDRSEGVLEVERLCKELNIPIEIQDRAIESIAYKENTYVIGIFKKYESTLEKDTNHLVLVEPSNMGNIGTVIRTMLGFGVKNLGIIKPAVDIFDPKVIRSTMGAIFQINFEYFNSIDEYIDKNNGNNLYPFMLDGGKDIRGVEFKEPFTMIQGKESTGLPDSYKNIGESIYIPYVKDIDSFNLSVATSIGLWEYFRRKNGII